MNQKIYSQIKKTVESNIPAASAIVAEIIKTIYDMSSNAKDIAKIIECDPPLVAKILRVANSAYYGSVSKISSITKAIVFLGFENIKEIVLSVSLIHYFSSADNEVKIDFPGIWIHSACTAKASQLIAQHVNIKRSDVAYTTGLLHDIGKILLALSFPEQYNEVLNLASKEKCHIIIAERKIFDVDHAVIGKILCDLWELPDEISFVLSHHHDHIETLDDDYMLAGIVCLGDYMSRNAKIGNPGDKEITEPSKAVFNLLGGSSDKDNKIFKNVYDELLETRHDFTRFFDRLG